MQISETFLSRLLRWLLFESMHCVVVVILGLVVVLEIVFSEPEVGGIGLVWDRGHVIYGDGHYHHSMEYIISTFAAVARHGYAHDDVKWLAVHAQHNQTWREALSHDTKAGRDNDAFVQTLPLLLQRLWPHATIIPITSINPKKTGSRVHVADLPSAADNMRDLTRLDAYLAQHNLPSCSQVEVVFVDRWWKYHGPMGKMVVKDLQYFDPHLWSRTLWRDGNLLQQQQPPSSSSSSSSSSSPSSSSSSPSSSSLPATRDREIPHALQTSIHVVYVDRQGWEHGSSEQQSRRLAPESHAALVVLLARISAEGARYKLALIPPAIVASSKNVHYAACLHSL